MSKKQIVILVLMGLFVVLLLQNMQATEIRLFFWKVSFSRAFLLLGDLGIGVVIGWLLKGIYTRRRRAPGRPASGWKSSY